MKLSDLITSDDGKTLEPAYAMSTLVIVIGLALEVYCTLRKIPFDLQAYGIGAGSLLAGLGISAKIGR